MLLDAASAHIARNVCVGIYDKTNKRIFIAKQKFAFIAKLMSLFTQSRSVS